jgi:hypothetical protein
MWSDGDAPFHGGAAAALVCDSGIVNALFVARPFIAKGKRYGNALMGPIQYARFDIGSVLLVTTNYIQLIELQLNDDRSTSSRYLVERELLTNEVQH